MRFTKAHGLGNDFILIAEEAAPAGFAGQPVLTVATFPPPEQTSGRKGKR